MIKKFFEAMLIGIWKYLKDTVRGLVSFSLKTVVFLFPMFLLVMTGRWIFPNVFEYRIAFYLLLGLPALEIGAEFLKKVQHSYRASKYAEEHNCDIREALEATKPPVYISDWE